MNDKCLTVAVHSEDGFNRKIRQLYRLASSVDEPFPTLGDIRR
jgi:hypothetical protein